MKRAVLVALLLAAGCQKGTVGEPASAKAQPPVTANIPADSKWAGSKIAWQSVDEGLALAKREGRPVMMVVKTEWCGRCKEFSALFLDKSVERAAEDFVMVLVDGDTDPQAASYAPDGTYIPRTFFLSPDGTIDESLRGPHPRYRYYLNSGRPEALTQVMARARDTLDG